MNILVIGPSWVGDMVMAQSLFKELVRLYPSANIDVLAPDACRPLLERMPEVRDPLKMPLGHGAVELKIRWKLGRSLKSRNYDWAILLPNTLKSALIPFFAGIPRRTGWRGEMRYFLLDDLRVLDETRYGLMVERFVALAHEPNMPLPDVLPKPRLLYHDGAREAVINKLGLDVNDRPVLALCPGAEFGEAKRWPGDKYAEVAAEKIEEGWQVWLLGSPKDRKGSDDIYNELNAEQKNSCFNLCGKTNLTEVVDLMSLADAVVSNDSGLMHIAAAVDVKTIALFGLSDPLRTAPYGDKHIVIRTGIDCSPCWSIHNLGIGVVRCVHPENICMKEISVDRVFQEAEGALS